MVIRMQSALCRCCMDVGYTIHYRPKVGISQLLILTTLLVGGHHLVVLVAFIVQTSQLIWGFILHFHENSHTHSTGFI